MYFLKRMSLMPKGLQYKTMIAFSLMSLIPLLVCVWLVTTYIFPNLRLFFGLSLGNVSFILFISIVISLLGLYVVKHMIDTVVQIAEDAKDIAEGNVDKVIEVNTQDEIGKLGESLNIMRNKIRDNIEELTAYGQKTKMINMEINKKVIVLSSLLQIGNLISASTELSTVLSFISQKISNVENGFSSLIMMLDEDKKKFITVAWYDFDEEKAAECSVDKIDAAPDTVTVDRDNPVVTKLAGRLLEVLGLKSIVIMPIMAAKVQRGMLVVGNKNENFVLKDDEREILNVFLKQAAIAIENDMLLKKAKELAVKDELTGLYNLSFIHSRLDEEIKRACMYQRPCGYVLVDIDNFEDYHNKMGEVKAEKLLKAMAEILKGAVSEIDKVGRLDTNTFAIVLPERNKKQSAGIAEDIRKKVEDNIAKILHSEVKITVTVGVSENPIDGSNAEDLMNKAEKVLKRAKALGKNRVDV